VVDCAFPAHVLSIQDDFLACDSQHQPVPKRDVNFFAVNLLDHRNAVTEHCYAVALFQDL
jgi:hypothetical protein